METLYKSVWGDASCLDQALQTVGVGIVVLLAVLPVIGGLIWWPFRKKPAESRLVLTVIMIVSPLLLATVAIWFAFFHQELREIRFGPAGFDVQTCRGLWQQDALHPAESITSIRHRLGRTGGKSPTTIDEIVVGIRDAEPLVLPISEIGNFDLAVLRRSIPQPVFEAWAAALRERGKPVPDWRDRAARGSP